MMRKKKIRVSKEVTLASTSYFAIGEETRARFKYHSLLQDYQELLKETKEKRVRLERLLQKKSHLLVQVKLLGKKFQQFSTTQTAQFKLKKQKVKEIPIPTSAPFLDLNQISEEMDMDRLKRFSKEDVLPNNSMLSICRDTRIDSNRAGKKKVSWQDQLTLKV